MEPVMLRQNGDLYLEGDFWKLLWRQSAIDPNRGVEGHRRKPTWIGPATGPDRLTKAEAQQIAWENFISRPEQNAHAPRSVMTVADFVQKMFVPEHVATKGPSGRRHYQAILKHVLTREEVDRAFQSSGESSKTRLKAVPGWPYLGSVPLCDVRPDQIEKLMMAAASHGYSTQTVMHIRNVVSAVFTHARKKQCFTDENPASLVSLPEMTRRETHVLTLAQAREMIAMMRYPEKEIALIAILAGLTVPQICGLQWKRVNLTDGRSCTDGEWLAPRAIAVRNEWCRGELVSVKKTHDRNLPIPDPLLPVLLALSRREESVGPDDFVLVSQAGTPIHADNIAMRRLKPIGRSLQMPWLSWNVLHRTHATLVHQFGMQYLGEHVASDR